MNISFISKRKIALSKLFLQEFNIYYKNSINDLEKDFMFNGSIDIVVFFEKVNELLVKQLKLTYPQVKVVLFYRKPVDIEKLRYTSIDSSIYIPLYLSEEDYHRRIENFLLNYHSESALPLVSYSNMILNPNTREVRIGHQRLTLRRIEFNLLELFLTYPKKVFSKSDLMDLVWNYSFDMDSHTVEVHIAKLRKKFSKLSQGKLFKTVHGKGYSFT